MSEPARQDDEIYLRQFFLAVPDVRRLSAKETESSVAVDLAVAAGENDDADPGASLISTQLTVTS